MAAAASWTSSTCQEILAEEPNGATDVRPAPTSNVTVEPGRILLPEEGVSLKAVERDLVAQALERSDGNQSQAARLLRISRDQLRYKMKKFDLG